MKVINVEKLRNEVAVNLKDVFCVYCTECSIEYEHSSGITVKHEHCIEVNEFAKDNPFYIIFDSTNVFFRIKNNNTYYWNYADFKNKNCLMMILGSLVGGLL